MHRFPYSNFPPPHTYQCENCISLNAFPRGHHPLHDPLRGLIVYFLFAFFSPFDVRPPNEQRALIVRRRMMSCARFAPAHSHTRVRTPGAGEDAPSTVMDDRFPSNAFFPHFSSSLRAYINSQRAIKEARRDGLGVRDRRRTSAWD